MNTKNQTPAASASRHTPEPWQAIKWTSHAEATIAKLNNNRELVTVIGDCTGHGQCSDDGIANAARIVACVNFAAGIPNEQLTAENGTAVRDMILAGMEPGAVAGLVAAAERMVAALAQEREMRGIAGDGSRVEAELRAALAAAKGGAK